MKKLVLFLLTFLIGMTFIACDSNTTSTTESTILEVDNFDYTSLTFPNYSLDNPARYLSEDEYGNEYHGWQNFGLTGEIMTYPWIKTTYTYQMYSFFIRTDLQTLYNDVNLPDTLSTLPEWIANTQGDGNRILWYSMGQSLPEEIILLDVETITATNNAQTFIRAEYSVTINTHLQQWIVYFMDVDGVYSSYSIRVNDNYDTVLSTADFIVQSYQLKTPPIE